jgi:PadR family transcriptional regulator, regulatory protein AphA
MPEQTDVCRELFPKYVIMGFLYIRPMHGYDLHNHLETSLSEVWHIPRSHTYHIVKQLEKDIWITATRQPQGYRPDRKLLALTKLGKDEFETWLYSPTSGSNRAIRVEFITRLFFASNLNMNLCSQLIREQTEMTRSDLTNLSKRLSALPADQIFNRMGLDLCICQLTSVLEWVEDCSKYFVRG